MSAISRSWPGSNAPDFMHLDQKDQSMFTKALVSVLRQRGVLKNL